MRYIYLIGALFYIGINLKMDNNYSIYEIGVTHYEADSYVLTS